MDERTLISTFFDRRRTAAGPARADVILGIGDDAAVLRRVLGRTRHMITHPDGTRSHPRIYARDFAQVPGLREYRLTLHADQVVVVQVVTAGGLSSDRQALLVERVRDAMGYPYPVVVREVRAIDWSSANKQDDFGVSGEPSTA